MKIIPAEKSHFDQILDLNENAVPHVNSISMETLEKLALESKLFLAVINDTAVEGSTTVDDIGEVVAFLLTMDQHADYQSLNYQYFLKNYEQFLYVDRIVVKPSHHRLGLGKRLYEFATQSTHGEYPILTCEVNVQPPNPDSLRFHEKCGFEGVAEQDTENGTKRVLLMVKNLVDAT